MMMMMMGLREKKSEFSLSFFGWLEKYTVDKIIFCF